MTTMTRRAAIVAVCVLALSMTACSNNSGGKIVGKWKVVGGTKQADMKSITDMGAAMYFDFSADSKFKVGFIATKPESEKLIELMNGDPKMAAMSGTYSLGMGDTVNFSGGKGAFDGKEKATTQFKRNGDKATMKDPDGTSLDLELVK
jgi:hypothetical protein